MPCLASSPDSTYVTLAIRGNSTHAETAWLLQLLLKLGREACSLQDPTVSDSDLTIMAEILAKTRLGLKSLKLVICMKAVKLTITVDQGSTTTPSEKLLTR